MPALLPHDRPRWVWPASLLATLVLGILALFVPEAWWWLLVPDKTLRAPAREITPAAFELVELEIRRPPPVIETASGDAVVSEEPVFVDTDWWNRAWEYRIEADLSRAGTAIPDTLLPAALLEIYGAGATLDLILASPDSVVEARLWQLVQEDELRRDDLDGVFAAIAKARAFADLKAREAAMYDEF